MAHDGEGGDGNFLGVDTGKFCGFRISADRINIATQQCAACDKGHDQANGQCNENWNCKAVGNKQPFGWHGDVVCSGIFLDDTLWPIVTIDE
jgi:hypothetical protein